MLSNVSSGVEKVGSWKFCAKLYKVLNALSFELPASENAATEKLEAGPPAFLQTATRMLRPGPAAWPPRRGVSGPQPAAKTADSRSTTVERSAGLLFSVLSFSTWQPRSFTQICDRVKLASSPGSSNGLVRSWRWRSQSQVRRAALAAFQRRLPSPPPRAGAARPSAKTPWARRAAGRRGCGRRTY